MSVVHKCKPTDFSPVPKVAIEVLHIERKQHSLIPESEIAQYNDFVAYAFNKSVPIIERAFPKLKHKPIGQRVISTLTTEEIVNLYYHAKEFSHFYKGYAQKIAHEQKSIEKIFRTRKAKEWKKIM